MKKMKKMPLLVYLGLWRIESRQKAVGYLSASVLMTAGAAVAYLLLDRRALGGVIGFGLASCWFILAIRWVDKNSSWDVDG
jgi:hypothetical protein